MNITLADVKQAAVALLRDKIPHVEVYSEDTAEGFERSTKAALFVEVLPVQSNNMGLFREFTASVRVSYHPDAEHVGMSVDLYGELLAVFAESLPVGEKLLTIEAGTGESDEGVRLEGPLQFSFEVTWHAVATKVVEINQQIIVLNPRLGYTEESLKEMQDLVLRKE